MDTHPFQKRNQGAFIASVLLLLAALPALAIGVVAANRLQPEPPVEANLLELVRLSRAVVQRVEKPDVVRGVYLTSKTAGSDLRRGDVFDLIDRTELNAAVIDIKSEDGRVAYPAGVTLAQDAGIIARNPYDLETILTDARSRGIYTIARLPVFEDPALAIARPDLALTTKGGGFWRTRKGVAWVDPTNREVWKYAADLTRDALARGFNEVQLDYVRFPSDGALADTAYDNWSSEGDVPKYAVVKEFFEYVRQQNPEARISADLFGLTIGQRLRDGLANFDFISPMIYPSHYGAFYAGHRNPGAEPGLVIASTMDAALPYLTTLPGGAEKPFAQIRPWLQDFNLGAVYTPELVRAQIDEVEARGAEGWLLWDPANTYTEAALRAAE